MTKHKIGDKGAIIGFQNGRVANVRQAECVRVTASGQNIWKIADGKEFRFTASGRLHGQNVYSFNALKLETDPESIATYARQFHRTRAVDRLRAMGANVSMYSSPQDLLAAVAMIREKVDQIDAEIRETMREDGKPENNHD